MKLKLKQRIALSYYKTTIRTISFLSKRKAAEKAFKIFCTPYSKTSKIEKPIIFKHAEKVEITIDGLVVRGWQWIPENNNGKKILIAHGFNSNSYKFEKYIHQLTKAGFIVLAFDAPAHGISDGKTINAILYRNTMIKIDEKYGSLYGLIAHSLGGLSAAFAAEELKKLKKLVLIAPATETSTAVDNFFELIPLGENVKSEMILLIEELAGKPFSYYSIKRAIKNIKAEVLWLHDENDTICPINDVKQVEKLDLKNVNFIFTKALGHNKIYKIEKNLNLITDFIRQNDCM